MIGGSQIEHRISVVEMTMSAIGCKFKHRKETISRTKQHFDRSGNTFVDRGFSIYELSTKLKLKFETNIKFKNDDEVKQMMHLIFKPPSARAKKGPVSKGLHQTVHGYIIDDCALTFIAGL